MDTVIKNTKIKHVYTETNYSTYINYTRLIIELSHRETQETQLRLSKVYCAFQWIIYRSPPGFDDILCHGNITVYAAQEVVELAYFCFHTIYNSISNRISLTCQTEAMIYDIFGEGDMFYDELIVAYISWSLVNCCHITNRTTSH